MPIVENFVDRILETDRRARALLDEAQSEKKRLLREARERAEADVRRRDEQAKAGCAAVNEEFARREAEAAEAADRDYLRCKRALDEAFEEHRKAWLAEITGALRKGE